jgi:hypothetical protein
LCRPGFDYPLLAFGTNPVEFRETIRRLLNDVKDCFLECLDEFFGKVWADAFDHAGAQILFDAFEGAGWDDAQVLCLELQAMGPIVDPPAGTFNVFPRGDCGCCAHNRDEITMTTNLDPEDAEARLFAMERHALDCTGQVFRGMTGGWVCTGSIADYKCVLEMFPHRLTLQ